MSLAALIQPHAGIAACKIIGPAGEVRNEFVPKLKRHAQVAKTKDLA